MVMQQYSQRIASPEHRSMEHCMEHCIACVAWSIALHRMRGTIWHGIRACSQTQPTQPFKGHCATTCWLCNYMLGHTHCKRNKDPGTMPKRRQLQLSGSRRTTQSGRTRQGGKHCLLGPALLGRTMSPAQRRGASKGTTTSHHNALATELHLARKYDGETHGIQKYNRHDAWFA